MPNFQPRSQYFNNYPLTLEIRASEYGVLFVSSCSVEVMEVPTWLNIQLTFCSSSTERFLLQECSKQAGEKAVKASWDLQIPRRDVKLSDSFESNCNLPTMFLSLRSPAATAFRPKLHLGKLNLWLVVNLFSAKQWRMSPISAGSGSQNYQKRPTSRENNWLLFCDSVNYKIVKTSCGIKTTASEAFLYSLIYFPSLSLCSLFSVIFVSQTSNHSPELLSIPSFQIPSCLRSQWMSLQHHLREFKSHRRPPSHFSFLQPDSSVFDCYCTSRQSTSCLMGGKGRLN